ncbi:MAG: hypothetical protein FJX53_05060, partial [Alphaproteobacteria bacterium]|nr:hypothetical protein [Alphaproteobacteria bacterium]
MSSAQSAIERRALQAWRWRMAGGDDGDDEGGGTPPRRGNNQTGVITRTKTRTKKPSMYKVLMLNDDYTPME